MKKFNETEIKKLLNDDNWGAIHSEYELPESFVLEHISEINWSQYCWYNIIDFNKISDDFLKKYHRKMYYTMNFWMKNSRYEEKYLNFIKFLKSKKLMNPPDYFNEL